MMGQPSLYCGTMSASRANQLGTELRAARRKLGVGLKEAGPAVGVSYTHLSKIENGVATPSADLLGRLILYYGATEPDELYAAAGLLPPDIVQIVSSKPIAAYSALRAKFDSDRR